MSLIDKDICRALDRMHVELAGLRDHCRWTYDSKTDTYACDHVRGIPGRDVIKEVNPYMVE